MNMIRLLSADQYPSNCGIVSLGNSGFSSLPSAFIVHRPIFPLWMRVNRNFLSSGDQERCWIKSPLILETQTGAGSGSAKRSEHIRKEGATALHSCEDHHPPRMRKISLAP